MSERKKERAVKVRGSKDFSPVDGEFKAGDSVRWSNPADPWAVVRDWKSREGSRSIPLSAECESSTVIPSTLTHNLIHSFTHTAPHAHLGPRVCAVWGLLINAVQGKRLA